MAASPSLLSQAAELQVLPEIPEYRGHRALSLELVPSPAPQRSTAKHADPESEGFGPPPTFAAPLRLTPDRLSSFAAELKQPAKAEQLRRLTEEASRDPLLAATQLHAILYGTAAAVFPPTNAAPRQAAGSTSGQLRRRHQPWFDEECAATRRQIRLQMQASLNSGQPSHLAKEALRIISNRYTRLRKRKAGAWQRQQGSSLLHMQRTDARKFFKQWQREHPKSPIDAATWLRHFVNLQLKRTFQPTASLTATSNPATSHPTAAIPSCSPPTATVCPSSSHPTTAVPATSNPTTSHPTAAISSCSPSAATVPSSSQPTTAPPAINPATCHSTPLSTASSELDSDISVADVHAALDKLSSSSACLGPLKAVLIKAGRDALTPVLAALFNAVFRSGCFPPEWSLGAITPIHKKGDTADPNNYRGITVGHILGKLYALAINTRLNTWLETQGLRARGQAGFRQGYRTVDNCFILRALAERARSRGVKLYLCAVDFEKAFDSVDRPLLWAALQRAGIGGTMLQAIQAMYADVPVCVRTEEGLSGCFQSVLGVKQGCPLSPLLFGIFLDDFEGHIQQLGDAAALPQLAGRTVPPLLFADDMFLLSSSASGLQAQLHALQDYCNAKKLTVNAKKTQVMIMRPGGGSGNGKLAAGESFEYAGLPLEVASSTKYLGLTFSQLSKQHGFASCADVLAKAGRQAMFAMRRRAWELGACLVEQQCMLFDVFVKPVLSYGCELWGVDVLLRPDCSSVERVHRWFCRRVQGLPKQVTAAISLAELGRQPLQSFWIQQLVRFWNRLQNSAADEDRVLGWAFKDNLELMREGGDLAAGSACWSRRWLHVLQSAPPASGTLEWLTELDEAAVIERAAAAYLRNKYGLKSPAEVEEYITLLGDEVAQASACPAGADVLLAGDINAHTGSLPDVADHSKLLHAALHEEAALDLAPCTAQGSAFAPPPRISTCTAAVCEQGKALLQLCCITGMLIANGRVHGDVPASTTCYSGQSSSVVDYMAASPSLLSQAAELQVLPEIPEYRGHRALSLELVPSPAPQRSTAKHADPESEGFGPPPTFAAPLRLTPDRLSSFAAELKQPAKAEQLRRLTEEASRDPLLAATQLHAILYGTAAAVFPPTNAAPRQAAGSTSGQLRRRHQPWFDEECAATRRQIRLQMQASLNSGQPSHLAKEALRIISNRYTRLRKRKAGAWQRQQGSSLLHMQRTDARKFFKQWQREHPKSPIDAATWLRHFVNLQLKRTFQPTASLTATSNPATSHPTAAIPSCSPPTATVCPSSSHPTTAVPATSNPTTSHPTAAISSCSPSAATVPSSSQPTTAPPAINPATCHSTPLSTASSELDSDISVADVHAALDKLSSSSACLGPLKAVLIKAGRDALTPVLAALFNAVFRSGCFPPEWSLGAITPIHKKGDTADPNNYRGITVGHILGKLYALAINTRLNTWLETQGLRARGQAGFRQGYRTVDNCFILRALAERARSRGVKLYLCAVDFEKAFDSVDRPLLWAALQRAGIGGTMLQAIQAMYADVPVCVRTEEGLSGCFQSVLGVKQGCPLSPLLFGIFLDDFEGHIQQLGDAAALPQLAGRTVPPLLFADDMFLLSSSASGLQAQLHALQDYCNAKKLTVNAKKTQVMIMRPGGGSGNGKLAAGESFEYAGLPLEVASSTKYLGLTFSQLSKQHGFASCADVLAKAGRQAMFAMRRRAWELGACLVEQQCMLFDVFVKPVLSYGCELWGVDVLLRPDCSSVERVHRWFCRRVQGLPKQVTAAISLAELGRQPLQSFWIQQLVRFWNRLQNSAADEDRVLGWAFKDNLELMREGGDLAAGSACWSRRWLHVLQSAPPASGTLEWLTELDEAAVIERAAAAYLRNSSAQHSKARRPESEGFGPPPTFAAPLRLTPDRLSSFAAELKQPAKAEQLRRLTEEASRDPLLAATQLHAILYGTAAAVFPPTNAAPRQAAGSTSGQLRRRHQPWFDEECAATRRQIRLQMQASLNSGQPSHLAKEALRIISNRYTRLRKRKAGAWQRQQGSSLLHMQRTDARKFFKQWQREHPKSPIDAATWLRHFVNLQLKRTFQPTASLTATSNPATSHPTAAIPSCSPPTATPTTAPPAINPATCHSTPLSTASSELDSDISVADVHAALDKLSSSSACLGPLKAVLIKAGRDALTPRAGIGGTMLQAIQAMYADVPDYCNAKKLTVNAKKTQVMIMRPGGGSGNGKLAAGESF
ncbi:hypothetical protein D9Q98_010363 [Chlorella vulgaris]|uniref:Reverse transcriptase domain-containing protein n=1 Tax=Chlorella vulgaris TaxID=3077 RepID=A0A9D4TK14_CHLVU|nr:hypothetical protein D9Q98_010363 [Chlorella vulgaris]